MIIEYREEDTLFSRDLVSSKTGNASSYVALIELEISVSEEFVVDACGNSGISFQRS